jgi:hypothetical protein
VITAVLCLPLLLAVGCQSRFRKQPHAAQQCLSSDPRYFPSGAEFKLENQKKALAAYKLECEQRRATLAKDDQ